MDFKEISNIIFSNKRKYSEIADKDKETSFYIINKKLSLGSIKLLNIANFFNNKFLSKILALDMWFLYFRNTKLLPGTFYQPLNKKKVKSLITPKDKELLLQYNELDKKSLDFLLENYLDDVNYEIKKLKRFSN